MNPQTNPEVEASSRAQLRNAQQAQTWLKVDYRNSGVCAWCLAEAGVAPQRNQSHGICERHALAWLKEAGL